MRLSRYIAPVMFLLLSVAIYLSYIDPTYVEAQKALARERVLVGYINDAKTAQSRIDDLKAQYAEFPAGSDRALHTLIPDSIDPTRLVVDMDAVIGKLGLVMKSPGVTIEKGADESSLDKYYVNFSVSAPYSVFRNFLHDLEASLALRDMGSISFAAAGIGSNELTGVNAVHTYNLTVTTYSLHQEL
jgi:hypothetical protein